MELTRLGAKPKEALPRRYDAEMYAALKQVTARKIFTEGNAVVWPERFRKVVYYEMEKEVFKLKPQWKALTSSLEHMFWKEEVTPTGDKK